MSVLTRAQLKDLFNTGETITEQDMIDLIDSLAILAEVVGSDLASLTAASALDGSELFYAVQSGNDRKATGTQIQTFSQVGMASDADLAADVATLEAADAALDARVDTLEASGSTNPLTTLSMYDDFAAGSASPGSLGDLGWTSANGALTLMDGETNHPGILRRETTTTISQNAYMILRSTPSTGMFLPAAMFDMLFITRLNTNDANTTSRFGMMNSAASTTPTGGIYFEKLDGDTNWFAVCRSATVQTRTDTAVAVSTGWITRRIRRIDASTIGFTINGGTELTITSNIPTAAMTPAHQVQNSAAANKTIDLDYWQMTVSGISR